MASQTNASGPRASPRRKHRDQQTRVTPGPVASQVMSGVTGSQSDALSAPFPSFEIKDVIINQSNFMMSSNPESLSFLVQGTGEVNQFWKTDRFRDGTEEVAFHDGIPRNMLTPHARARFRDHKNSDPPEPFVKLDSDAASDASVRHEEDETEDSDWERVSINVGPSQGKKKPKGGSSVLRKQDKRSSSSDSDTYHSLSDEYQECCSGPEALRGSRDRSQVLPDPNSVHMNQSDSDDESSSIVCDQASKLGTAATKKEQNFGEDTEEEDSRYRYDPVAYPGSSALSSEEDEGSSVLGYPSVTHTGEELGKNDNGEEGAQSRPRSPASRSPSANSSHTGQSDGVDQGIIPDDDQDLIQKLRVADDGEIEEDYDEQEDTHNSLSSPVQDIHHSPSSLASGSNETPSQDEEGSIANDEEEVQEMKNEQVRVPLSFRRGMTISNSSINGVPMTQASVEEMEMYNPVQLGSSGQTLTRLPGGIIIGTPFPDLLEQLKKIEQSNSSASADGQTPDI